MTLHPKPKFLVTAKAYLSALAIFSTNFSDLFYKCFHWVSAVRGLPQESRRLNKFWTLGEIIDYWNWDTSFYHLLPYFLGIVFKIRGKTIFKIICICHLKMDIFVLMVVLSWYLPHQWQATTDATAFYSEISRQGLGLGGLASHWGPAVPLIRYHLVRNRWTQRMFHFGIIICVYFLGNNWLKVKL